MIDTTARRTSATPRQQASAGGVWGVALAGLAFLIVAGVGAVVDGAAASAPESPSDATPTVIGQGEGR